MLNIKSYVYDVRNIFLDPKNFYTKSLKLKNIKDVYSFFLFLTIFSAITSAVSTLLIGYSSQETVLNQQFYITILSGVIFYVTVSFLLGFFWAFLLHVWAKLFKAKGDYLRSYQLFVYSFVPSAVLGWMPIVKIIVPLYGVYLLYLGMQKLHKLSPKRTLAALLLLLVLVIIYSLSSVLSATQITQ